MRGVGFAACAAAFAILPAHAQTVGPVPIAVPHYGTAEGGSPIVAPPQPFDASTNVPRPQPLTPLGRNSLYPTDLVPLASVRRRKH
jgi:hypothetical protein